LGVDVSLFEHIHSLLIEKYPLLQGNQTGRPFALNSQLQLALVLQFLRSMSDQTSIGQAYSVPPSTTSRIINRILPRLLLTLVQEEDARIRWPDQEEMKQFADIISAKYPNIPYGVFAFVDGLVLPILNHGNPYIQNSYYNGYTSSNTTTNVCVFAPDGTICFASINHPGNFHDSRACRVLYETVNDPSMTPDPYKLLGDSAFPSHTGKIIALKRKSHLSSDPEERKDQIQQQRTLSSARQSVEWGMRIIQGTWQRLHNPLKADDFRYNFILLRLCLHLCNIRTRRMGIFNQIQNVFQ
jgi:hypothetical protein